MDPFSFAANVITVIEFSAKLHDLVSRWNDAPETLRNLEQTVCHMETVLRLITNKSKVASTISIDQEHIDAIEEIAKKCSKLVTELSQMLPTPDKSDSSLERFRSRLSALLKERNITDKRDQLQGYKLDLDMLLTSLNSKQGSRIETIVGDIYQKIDDFFTLPSYTGPAEDGATPQEDPAPTGRFDFLLNNAAHSDEDEGDRRPSIIDGIHDGELRDMRKKVDVFQSRKMFRKAAQVQQNIVEMVKSHVGGQSNYDICDLQEQHADLLLECSTPACLQEATTILAEALQRQRERAPSNASLVQQGRLMSKLAKLYRDGDGLEEKNRKEISESFFTNSIIYLEHTKPFLPEDFLTVGEAMVHFSEAHSEIVRARVTKQEILETMKQQAPDHPFEWDELANTQETSVLAWCREQGFSADLLQFRFDTIQASKSGNTSPLHLAVQEGQIQIVQKMLVEVEDVNFLDDNGMTPLLLAAQKRQSKIAQVLLNAGALTDVRTRDKQTALHLCLEGDPEGGVNVTKCLLDGNPELINWKDGEGRTALHLAVLKGHHRIVRLLLKRNADPNIQEGKNKTALHFAVLKGNQSIATLLLERRANPNIQELNGKTPLLMAIESRVSDDAQTQDSLGRVSTAATSASMASSMTSNTTSNTISNTISNATSSATSSATTSSRRSSETSQRPAAELPLTRASRASIIELLLKHRADPNIADNTDNRPLHNACKQGDINTIKTLLESWTRPGRSLVNEPGPMKATPIIIAVKGQNVAIVRELVRWGANANQKDRAGHSAEDYARKPGAKKHELMEALKDAGI